MTDPIKIIVDNIFCVRCRRCGRRLTTEEAIKKGLGARCEKKLSSEKKKFLFLPLTKTKNNC